MDGILEAVGLSDVKMVVANISAIDEVFRANHLTLQEKNEVLTKFEDPERMAVFVPKGRTGVVIVRGSKDPDLFLSTIGRKSS